MALSTAEIKLVNLVNSRQEAKSRQFGKGNYGPAPTPEEWQALVKYYSQEEYFPYYITHNGPSCNLALVRQLQGEEGKPETKHAPVITNRGKQTPRYSLKCKYRDGREFTLPGNKFGWEPEFQLKSLLRYVDTKWHRIKHCQLFDNSRTAPNNWLYKWNTATGEYEENTGWHEASKFHRYPTGKDTFALKADDKHRILKKFNAWFYENQTPIITLNPEVTGSQK